MATAKEELTTKRLENLTPAAAGRRFEIADTHVSGLRVRVGDAVLQSTTRRRNGRAGQVSFVLLARFKPKANPTRRTLGTFPELSLSDARQKAIDWKGLIRRGIDPADDAKQRKADAERRRLSQRTTGEVLDQYESDRLAKLRRGKATRRALDGSCGLLTEFRDRELTSISRSEVRAALRKRAIVAPISANRQLAYAKAFFNWCVAEEIVSANPAQSILKPSSERARDRHHSLGELKDIWRAALELGYPFGHLVRLLIVLPMRREELAAMPTAEIDLGPEEATEGIWTLPAERTKRANALRVPLAPLARAIISEAVTHEARPKKSPFAFSMTETTSISGFAKAKKRLDRTITANRVKSAEAFAADPVPMPHWTFHDLRTSFTTLACEELGVDAAIADRILNHVASATTSKIMRVYNKSELFEQRRAALRAWENLLRERVIGLENDNIVQIRAAQA